MNLVREITDKLADQGDGVPYKLVRGTIAAMLEVVQEQLKKERRVRIPGLVTLRIRYKPAQKGGQKKINPFTKESYISKAKKAENKLKASPAKQLKDYALKLPVVASKRKATAA